MVMRKFFNTLKSLVATAVMVSMLGTASLATSCVDEYDDTTIKGQISEIKIELAELTKRIAALETKLSDEVKALKALIDDQNVVVSAEKVGDNWEIVLSDGTEFTVYGQWKDTDTDTDTDVDTYLVPKEDTDGVWYWAVVDDTLGEELTEEWLLVNGEKVPVFSAACDCVPTEPCDCEPAELKFEIDDNGDLLISIDGGKTWENSGLDASGMCQCDPDQTNCIITGVDTTSEEGFVIFTLADGTTVKVAVGELVEFSVKSTLYVGAGESQEVTFEAGEAVKDVEVMNQPAGWKATVEGNVLTVTAPSKELVDLGVAEKKGIVSLHINTASGACKVAKLSVAFAEVTLTIDKQGNIVVTNSMVATFETTDPETWMPIEKTDFLTWEIGGFYLDSYTGDLEESLEDWYMKSFSCGNGNLEYYGFEYVPGVYKEGVYEVDYFMGDVKTLVDNLGYGMEYEGKSFLIYVVPMNMKTYSYDYDKAAIAEFKQTTVKVEELTDLTNFAEIYLNVSLSGAEKFYVGYTTVANLEEMDEWMGMEDYYYFDILNSWVMYASYGATLGDTCFTGDYVNEEILLNELILEGESNVWQADMLKPNTEYELYVMPYTSDRPNEDYTVEDFIRFRFKTEPLVEGGVADVAFECTAGYTELNATVTITDENFFMAYYGWYNEEQEVNDELVDAMLNSNYPTLDNPFSAQRGALAQGQTMTLVVMAVDNMGQYTFAQKSFTTDTLKVNEEYTLAFGEITFTDGALNIPVTGMDGADVVKYRWYIQDASNYSVKDQQKLETEMPLKADNWYEYKTVTAAEFVNPIVATTATPSTYTTIQPGKTFVIGIMAFFADGSISNIAYTEHEIALAIAAPTADTVYPTFEITVVKDTTWGGYDVNWEVNKPEGVSAVYSDVFGSEYIQNYPLPKDKIAYVMDCNNTSGYRFVNNNDPDLYYTWADEAGVLYHVQTIDLEPYFAAADAAAEQGGNDAGDDEGIDDNFGI